MIDDWMNNPEQDDRNQRLEIMKAYYTFEESRQKLTDDQADLVMLNQIRKMVSLIFQEKNLIRLNNIFVKILKNQDLKLKNDYFPDRIYLCV